MRNNEVKKYYEILRHKKISLITKRTFDFLVALIMTMIASPILLAIAILIKIDSKGPVFYRQERVTSNNRTFRIFKFRTMVQNADKIGTLVTVNQDPRITRVGNKIRKCRLDELPQLLNIITGDMSFVGTRPEVRKYVDNYTEEMMATLLLPAGVTSLASIKFKDEDEIMEKYIAEGESVDDIYIERILPEKMKYNVEYLKAFSFFRDIKLMFKTVLSVIK
ncbi:MAG: sugar transferase [Firmicutes bacterium]|nr:sugar transferase [Bacillota bacterium]